MAASKFIAKHTEYFVESHGMSYAEAMGKAETLAIEEGLIPSPERNAKARRQLCVNPWIGEQVKQTRATIKRLNSVSALDSDCLRHDKEFSK